MKLKIVYITLCALILLTSAYIRFAQVANYNFPFTMDQARDMLDLRSIVVGKHLTLIGPTTSINGVFLGPSYYYLNTLPFIIGGGDPSFLVYWNIVLFLLGGLTLFAVNIKKNAVLGLTSSLLFLISPALFTPTRYFWNSNTLPYFTIFYFLTLIYYLRKPTYKKALLLGFISGICMHFQAAFGILFFPFAVIASIFKKDKPLNLLAQFLGFSVTLLPQLLFELRHGFGMTKIFLAEVSGSGEILGEKLTYTKALASHFSSFSNFVNGILALPFSQYIFVLSVILLIFMSYKKKLDQNLSLYFWSSLGFIVFAFLFYSFYRYPLKDWFILGLRIPYLIIFSAFLSSVFNSSFKKSLNWIPKLIVAVALIYSSILTIQDQLQFVPKDSNFRSDDRSNLRNEIEAIDWVYQKAENKGFKAYNYIPSVYDFPYQYLYFWYGTKKYGYQPQEISYLEGVSEYIPNNKDYLTKTRPQEDGLIALIYEDDENVERKYAWGGSFTKYCPVTDIRFSWGTSAEIRKACPEGVTNQNKLR